MNRFGENIYTSFCPIPGATRKEQHMRIEIENAEVTRVWENTRGQYTDYCLNVKFMDGKFDNFLCLKSKDSGVFADIHEGDIIEKATVYINGRAWESPKDGQVVFTDFKVTSRQSITLKAAVAKKPILACDWKAAQLAFIEAKGLGDSSADEIKKAFCEFCKATIPGKAAKDYKPVDWATIHNAATGAREETPEEEAAPDFGSDLDDLPF